MESRSEDYVSLFFDAIPSIVEDTTFVELLDGLNDNNYTSSYWFQMPTTNDDDIHEFNKFSRDMISDNVCYVKTPTPLQTTEFGAEYEEDKKLDIVVEKDIINNKKNDVHKRERKARFSFKTRSKVDNLEDGYRWRKYGQKAVKNSPFPRNYYRCTTPKCVVKKHVERSSEDPSVVVTTYEGQHTHSCPGSRQGTNQDRLGPMANNHLQHHNELMNSDQFSKTNAYLDFVQVVESATQAK